MISDPSKDFDLTTYSGIQQAVDQIDRGYGPYKAEVLLPPGLINIEKPIWMDRAGITLVGQGSTRLRTKGGYGPLNHGLKRLPVSWEAAHTVSIGGGKFGWKFNKDSYLLLRGTPFDLGPWKGNSLQDSRLVDWDKVRNLRVQISLIQPQWTRQGIFSTLGAFDGNEPDPIRLYCSDPGVLVLEAKTKEGPDIYLRWKAPQNPQPFLDINLNLNAGSAVILQDNSPVQYIKYNFPVGCHLRHAGATEFCVGRGIPQPYDHGDFTLISLQIDADGELLGKLDPLSQASNLENLWKWTGKQGGWGYGLLRNTNFTNYDSIRGTGIRNLRVSIMDGYPYGCGILMGLGLSFFAERAVIEHGARGFDQCLMNVSYPMKFTHCDFWGHHHCGISTDYSIVEIKSCEFNGYGPRYFIHSRATNAHIEDCFFGESGEGLRSGICARESGTSEYRKIIMDFETPERAPESLFYITLGRANGGITPVKISDTPGACAQKSFVALDDLWGGRGGTTVSPGFCTLDNSFLSFGDKAPKVFDIKGNWDYEIRGPRPLSGMRSE